jgi:hypothetical protein
MGTAAPYNPMNNLAGGYVSPLIASQQPNARMQAMYPGGAQQLLATLQALYSGAGAGNIPKGTAQAIGLIPMPTGPTGIPIGQPSIVWDPKTMSMVYAQPPAPKEEDKK